MATIRLIPSTYAVSSATYLSVSDASNMYANTDSTTFATINNTYASTSARYLYLRGFNFDDIPANATINSWTVKVKGYEYRLNTGTSYAPRLTNGTNALSGTGASENFDTSVKTIQIPTGALTWTQIKNYGANFTIRICVARASKNQSGSLYVYGAEIEVNYTTDVHPTSVTLDQNAVSLEEGDTVQLTETVLPSNATNKNVTWSSSDTSVATVSNGLVSAVSAGSATITVTTVDGGETATCAITVAQGMKVSVKVNGEWVQGTKVFIKQSGSWVQATKIYVKDNGSWES